MTSTTAPAATAAAAQATPDGRRFWRVLLAVVAPLPFLAKGVFYVISPAAGDDSFHDTVAAFEAHRGLLDTMKWLDAVFVVTLIPATIAGAWVARRGAPRLTTAAAFIALTGFFAGIALLGGVETPPLVTVQHNLDPSTMSALQDVMEKEPLLGVTSLLFIVGVVFGLGLLGGALRRSRSVPAWAAFAVMVGGATHPFIPTSVGQGTGLLVAAAGFSGVSIALWRMSDDDFDLPPVAARSGLGADAQGAH
ncbi:hypothetical protein ACVW00_000753 [Marmoricola sp. URHA0025 HA25]